MMEYYNKAIEKGNTNAMYSLSMFYRNRNQYYLAAKYELMINNKHNDEERIKYLAQQYQDDDRRRSFNNTMLLWYGGSN